MGGQWGRRREKVYLYYISETVRCRKLILVGILVRGCRCAMSWCDLDFTFDLAAVTLTNKILSGLYLGKLILGRDIGWGCRCATLWCDLDLTFGLAVVTVTYKILFGLYLGNCKV